MDSAHPRIGDETRSRRLTPGPFLLPSPGHAAPPVPQWAHAYPMVRAHDFGPPPLPTQAGVEEAYQTVLEEA